MLSKKELRNAHISMAVGAVVAFVGGFLARDAGDDVMQLVGLATLVASFGTMILLSDRDERRERREGKEPQ
jgi:uncharacterized membrane protein YfcA